jgi:hypothetical protein
VYDRYVSAKGNASDEAAWFYTQQGTADQALVMETIAPDNTLTQSYLYTDAGGGGDGRPQLLTG